MSFTQNWLFDAQRYRPSAELSKWQIGKIALLFGLFILIGASSIFSQGNPGVSWGDDVSAESVGLDPTKLQEFIYFVCKPKKDGTNGTGIFISRYSKKVALTNYLTKTNDPNNPTTPLIANENVDYDIASAFKPFLSHFLFKAEEESRLNLNGFVRITEPNLIFLNATNKDSLIRWTHLGNQTSCYGVMEDPGTAFAYCDYQTTLLWDLLFLNIFGCNQLDQSVNTLLEDKLTGPTKLQFQDLDKFTFLSKGGTNDIKRIGNLRITPRDFVRFGLLYLRKGRWNGLQLISENNVIKATTETVTVQRSNYHNVLKNYINPVTGSALDLTNVERCIDLNSDNSNWEPIIFHPELNINVIDCERNIGAPVTKLGSRDKAEHNGGYGWFWWKNKNLTLWPGVPSDTYACVGQNGQYAMVVIPKYDIVACWLNSGVEDDPGDQLQTAEAINKLIAAACEPPRAPLITYPTNNSILSILRPMIYWTPAASTPERPEPDDFMVRIHLGEDPVYTRSTGTETSNQVAFGKLLNGNTYKLSVRGHNAAGWGNWSDIVNFSIDVPGTKPAAPILSSPANFATVNKTPTLIWTAVTATPTVDNYKLQVLLNDMVVYEALTETATSHTVPNGYLKVGSNYKWIVRAHNDVNWSVWSDFRKICVR